MRDEAGEDKFILDLEEKSNKNTGIKILGVIFCLLIITVFSFNQAKKEPIFEKELPEINSEKQAETIEKKTKTPTLIPLELEIPALKLRANIVEVGKDEEGNMDVPKNVKEIGWYGLGYNPGELGHAVLSGHVTSRLGLPAVFRDLKKVEIGDEFILYGAANKKMTFEVVEINIYDYENAPLEKVFGKSEVPMVNLITCDTGIWLGNSYQDRLVVSGILIKEEEIESSENEAEDKIENKEEVEEKNIEEERSEEEMIEEV